MNTAKTIRTKEKPNGRVVPAYRLAVVEAPASRPRFLLRITGKERIERFTVPVVILPRHD